MPNGSTISRYWNWNNEDPASGREKGVDGVRRRLVVRFRRLKKAAGPSSWRYPLGSSYASPATRSLLSARHDERPIRPVDYYKVPKFGDLTTGGLRGLRTSNNKALLIQPPLDERTAGRREGERQEKGSQIHHRNAAVEGYSGRPGGYPQPYSVCRPRQRGGGRGRLLGRPPQLSTDAGDEQIDAP